MQHRHLPAPHWNENAPAVFRAIPNPQGEGAPLQGEDTRRVMAEVLGTSADEIQSLLDAGILEEHPLVAAEQSALV
jgi:crotonobetainyl-CoA:carnitine CoA-transferase CaiB-like acyl-CoA transferase